MIKDFPVQGWPVGFAAEQMKGSVLAYINAAKHRDVTTKDNAENYAWRLAMSKFAERLADKYGIELN